MDSLFELLFTLVAGALWLFGGSLFKSREDDDRPAPTTYRPRETTEEDFDEEELRQRKIREAIRRKIEEQRQQNAPESPVLQRQEPRKVLETTVNPATEPPTAVNSTTRRIARTTLKPTTTPYEKEIQKRLQTIEATKRKAEALKQQECKATAKNTLGINPAISEDKGTLFSGPVRTAFKNPQALRTAFICSEILGKPPGLRNPHGE